METGFKKRQIEDNIFKLLIALSAFLLFILSLIFGPIVGFLIIIPFTLVTVGLYELYIKYNQKNYHSSNVGGYLLYLGGLLLFGATCDLFFVFCISHNLYEDILQNLPNWGFLIAIFALAISVINGINRDILIRNDLDVIKQELSEIKKHLKIQNAQNDPSVQEKKKSLKKILDEISIDCKFIVGVCIIITIVLLCYDFLSQFNNPRIDIAGDCIRLLASIAIPLIFVYYTYIKHNELRFISALGGLVEEIINNTKKLTDRALNEQTDKMKAKIQENRNNERIWVATEKSLSLTNFNSPYGNFFRKYLPLTNYFYMINQGFFSDKISLKIEEGTKSAIAEKYDTYSKINVNFQGFENDLREIENIAEIDLFTEYKNLRDRSIQFEDKNYKKFLKESVAVVKELNNLYPQIDKEEEIADLANELSGVIDDNRS